MKMINGTKENTEMADKRWTDKELRETDDFTFAMCILSERLGMLNQQTPLAKKLNSAYHALEELRDICRSVPNYVAGTASAKEAIHWAVDRENTLCDIESVINDHDMHCVNLFDLNPEDVLGDHEIMTTILAYVDKYACTGDFWDNIECAIENGIGDVLEARGVSLAQ